MDASTTVFARSKRRAVNCRPQLVVERGPDSSSSVSTAASSRACAPPWARVGGQEWAASPISTTRPRCHGAGTTCVSNQV